jgi:hypothetical protein
MCRFTSSAAVATASAGETDPSVSTSSVRRSKSVRCPTRVSRTSKLARRTGL